MFLEFEGIDGAGKTMQCQRAQQWLQECSGETIIAKDLNGTELGQSARRLLSAGASINKTAEMYLFLACKSQLFSSVIIPALRSGRHVICDRGVGSFLSYFTAHGFNRKLLEANVRIATRGYAPSVTFLIDTPVDIAITRNVTKGELTQFDQMGEQFFLAQQKAYHKLAQKRDWVVIDGLKSIDDIALIVQKALNKML